jgi:hypothetical protein
MGCTIVNPRLLCSRMSLMMHVVFFTTFLLVMMQIQTSVRAPSNITSHIIEFEMVEAAGTAHNETGGGGIGGEVEKKQVAVVAATTSTIQGTTANASQNFTDWKVNMTNAMMEDTTVGNTSANIISIPVVTNNKKKMLAMVLQHFQPANVIIKVHSRYAKDELKQQEYHGVNASTLITVYERDFYKFQQSMSQ